MASRLRTVEQPTYKHPLLGLATAILCLSLLIGCGDEKRLSALQSGDLILAFGDSLTFGKGTSKDKAYPAVLESLSGHTVVNAGISGETTAEGIERLPNELTKHQPKLVILFEGGNDILQNLPADETKANLQSMISTIKNAGIQVVLVALPEKSLFSSSAPWYRELAEEQNLVMQSDIVSKLIKQPKMKSDQVHFNANGYRAVAEAIHEMLSENGAY